MTGSAISVVRGWWRPSVRFVVRTARRTVMDSLYLLTAPITAVVGALVVLGGLWVAAFGTAMPGGSRIVAAGRAPVRWFADLECQRIAWVRPTAAWARRAGGRPGRTETAAADPGRWLGVTHAMVSPPVVLGTAAFTALWWVSGVAAATATLRFPGGLAQSAPPLTLNAGDAQSHVEVSLGLRTAAGHATFATVLGVLLLLTLPLGTRLCVAIQAGLGRLLLSDDSPLHRRIAGLERERDTARAQTVAAVSAEATALRRLERDIHDGPQQRLVRLAMELGRAQHHLDTRPEAARAALVDALEQTQEALEELRALSRGIAPPILVDRGLSAALTAIATRSTVPADLDVEPPAQRLDAAVETAAYFVAAEALTNVAKHSYAGRCVIGLRQRAGTLRVWVSDDGVGGAALDKGHGLQGLDDRLHAVGGRLSITSPPGGPTTVTAELPCR